MEKKKDHEQLYYFDYFKKLYESWEESTNMMLDIWLSSPYMERAFDKSLEFKNYVQNFMEDTIKSRCEPKRGDKDSKDDKDRLVEYIDSLEKKIRELEEKVEELESQSKKKAPERRKKTKDEAAKETK